MKHGLEASFEKRHPGGPLIRIEDCKTLAENQVTVLFGASGSGKTTVLRCLAGLDRPDAGHIRFMGELWNDAANGTFMPARLRRIGLVPQDYALFPHMTVEGNVSYGLAELGPSARRQRIGETLDWLGITGLEKRWPAGLSGGQRQRVALARALAPGPRLLLLDEPLSALDHPTRVRLRRDLRGWLIEAGIPAILVTHDRTEAATLGDEIIVMHEGRMIQQGSVTDVLSKPVSHDVAGILAVETIVPGEIITMRDGIATVEVRGIPLQALAGDLPEGTRQVFVCIRAEDVSISSPDAVASSPRNRLPCIITACSREGPLVRMDLDCGFPLHALLTPQSCEEMTLTTGISTTAVIKAPKIHLIPR